MWPQWPPPPPEKPSLLIQQPIMDAIDLVPARSPMSFDRGRWALTVLGCGTLVFTGSLNGELRLSIV